MTMEIPKAEKIYSTTYENFRGVDFTNDMSNVWYRRSPDGTNMLPDEAGRPFKRTGWAKEITAQDFAEKYADDNSEVAPSEISIRKCYYFELAGHDHIVIFTNYGVFIYREGELLSFEVSYDSDMIESYERAFFFEGNGKSAFYIYGGYKIWEYAYIDEQFVWHEVEPYIPRVNVGVDARHEQGTALEAVNMLSDYVMEEFENNVFATVTSYTTDVTSATITCNEQQFLAMLSAQGTYVFTYTTADHSWLLSGDKVTISNYGISIDKTPVDGSTITVVVANTNRINLPRRMTSIQGMKVYASINTQFDTQLTLQATESQTTPNYVTLVTPQQGNSYLKFYTAYTPLVDGEDSIRVVYPRNAVTSQTHTITQTINVGAV